MKSSNQLNAIMHRLDRVDCKLEIILGSIETKFANISSKVEHVYNSNYQSKKVNDKRNSLLRELQENELGVLRRHGTARLYFKSNWDYNDARFLLKRFRLENIYVKNDFSFTQKCFYYHLNSHIDTFNLENRSEIVYYLTFTTFLVFDSHRKEFCITDRNFNQLKTIHVKKNFTFYIVRLQHDAKRVVCMCSNYEKMQTIYYVFDLDLNVLKSKRFRATYDVSYNFHEYDWNNSGVYINSHNRKVVMLNLNLDKVDQLSDLKLNKRGCILSFVAGEYLILNNLSLRKVQIINRLSLIAKSICIDDERKSSLVSILYDFACDKVFVVKKCASTERVCIECHNLAGEFLFRRCISLFDRFIGYHMNMDKVYLYGLNDKLIVF